MKKAVECLFVILVGFIFLGINVSADYVGSAKSNIYHYETCEWAKVISPKNKIRFKSVAEAHSKGYRGCYVCYPPNYDETVKSIKIENPPQNIHIGESKHLICTYSPAGAIDTNFSFKSSNMKVATIVGNILYAHSLGETKITVSTPNDVTWSYTLNVVPVAVEKVLITNEKSKLLIYEQHTLNCEVLPHNADDKRLTFIISNPNVVSVDSNGVLIGKNEGNATITVKCGNKSAELSIAVEKVLPEKIEIKKYSFVYPGFSEDIEVSIFPENTTDKNYKILSSQPDILSVVNGQIIAKKSGTAQITVSCGKISKTVEIKVRNIYTDIILCLSAIMVLVSIILIIKGNRKNLD